VVPYCSLLLTTADHSPSSRYQDGQAKIALLVAGRQGAAAEAEAGRRSAAKAEAARAVAEAETRRDAPSAVQAAFTELRDAADEVQSSGVSARLAAALAAAEGALRQAAQEASGAAGAGGGGRGAGRGGAGAWAGPGLHHRAKSAPAVGAAAAAAHRGGGAAGKGAKGAKGTPAQALDVDVVIFAGRGGLTAVGAAAEIAAARAQLAATQVVEELARLLERWAEGEADPLGRFTLGARQAGVAVKSDQLLEDEARQAELEAAAEAARRREEAAEAARAAEAAAARARAAAEAVGRAAAAKQAAQDAIPAWKRGRVLAEQAAGAKAVADTAAAEAHSREHDPDYDDADDGTFPDVFAEILAPGAAAAKKADAARRAREKADAERAAAERAAHAAAAAAAAEAERARQLAEIVIVSRDLRSLLRRAEGLVGKGSGSGGGAGGGHGVLLQRGYSMLYDVNRAEREWEVECEQERERVLDEQMAAEALMEDE
jgi:hypothetical protein